MLAGLRRRQAWSCLAQVAASSPCQKQTWKRHVWLMRRKWYTRSHIAHTRTVLVSSIWWIECRELIIIFVNAFIMNGDCILPTDFFTRLFNFQLLSYVISTHFWALRCVLGHYSHVTYSCYSICFVLFTFSHMSLVAVKHFELLQARLCQATTSTAIAMDWTTGLCLESATPSPHRCSTLLSPRSPLCMGMYW
jgi:hypothetical protein